MAEWCNIALLMVFPAKGYQRRAEGEVSGTSAF